MGFDRKATTRWKGDIKTGSGDTTLDSSGAAGPLNMAFPQRAGDPDGHSSPEELLAAAHATCFAMSVSAALTREGTPPDTLEASSVVTFSTDGGPHVERSALTLRGSAPGVDADKFREVAEKAKESCPVSKALAGVDITLEIVE